MFFCAPTGTQLIKHCLEWTQLWWKEFTFAHCSNATTGGIKFKGKKETWEKVQNVGKDSCQNNLMDLFDSKHAFDIETHSNCFVCVQMSPSTPVWHKMTSAIRLIRQSVSPATVTYPSPPTLVILRRKSTEFRLGGFHLRMSSHLPALYLCRDTQPPPPKKEERTK